jgi:TP901 family phage tail tape measure protein
VSLADTAQLSVELNLKGDFAPQVTRARNALGQFEKVAGTASKSTGLMAKQIAELKKGFLQGAGLAGGVVAFQAIEGGVRAIGDAIGNAIGQAGAFEQQMATINTIARLSSDALGDMGHDISELSLTAGRSTEDLTAGMYDLLSAGVDAADAMGVLEDATTLARGALSTTNEAVDLLTSTINAFGYEAADSSRLIDIFAKTVELGKVTASELATSIADIAPIAASTGVALEDVAAVYATMTASGVPAAEAANNLRQAIVSLITPSKELEALQKELNVNFADMLRARGVGETFSFLADSVGNNTGALSTMLGRVQALQAVLLTTNENAEGFAENLDAITQAADQGGVALQQAAIRADTFAGKQDRLNAAVAYFNRELGEIMLGPAGDFLEWLTDAIDGTPQLEGKVRDLALRLGIVGDELADVATEGDYFNEIMTKVGYGALEGGDAIGYTVDRLEGLGKTLDLSRRELEALARAQLEAGGTLDDLEHALVAEAIALDKTTDAQERLAAAVAHSARADEDFAGSTDDAAKAVYGLMHNEEVATKATLEYRRAARQTSNAIQEMAGQVDIARGSFSGFWKQVEAQQGRIKYFLRHPGKLRQETNRIENTLEDLEAQRIAIEKGGISRRERLQYQAITNLINQLRSRKGEFFNVGLAAGDAAERGMERGFRPELVAQINAVFGGVGGAIPTRTRNKGQNATGGVLMPGDYGTVGERGIEKVWNKGGVTVIEPMSGGGSAPMRIDVTVRPTIPAYEVNREIGRIGTTRLSGAGVL